MIHFVLCAFLAARLADFRAKLADVRRELRTTSHFSDRKRADVCAAAIELNATSHHFDVILVQTGRRTVFAFRDARLTSFDTVLVFFVCHFPCPPRWVLRRLNVAFVESDD